MAVGDKKGDDDDDDGEIDSLYCCLNIDREKGGVWRERERELKRKKRNRDVVGRENKKGV